MKVMCVEDEPDIREILEMTLTLIGGYDVVLFPSGSEAVEAAPDLTPDVVLLDMMMPGMDGLTTMKKLREMPYYAGIPIILVTAKIQKDEMESYCEAGATAVVGKPFDPSGLVKRIEEVVAEQR